MRRPRGLTLAETLVAIGLLSVVVLTVIGVLLSGLRLLTLSQEMTDASNIGRQFMEAVRERGGYSVIPPSISDFDGSLPDAAGPRFPPAPYPSSQLNGRLYTLRVRTAQSSDNVRAVLVEVAWEDDGSIILETAFHAADAQ